MNLTLTTAKKLASKGVKLAAKHLPVLLAAAAATGVVSTAVSASKAKPKADKIIEEHKKAIEEIREEDFETEKEFKNARVKVYLDTVKKLILVYLPTALIMISTIMCIFGAHHVNLRRQAAITAAYNLSEKAFTEYKDQVKDMIGPKKSAVLNEKIAENKVAKNPPKADQIIMTGNGEVVCCDLHTGRYFRSNPEFIREKVVDLNMRLQDEMYVSLNDYYDEIGLARVTLGDELGWNIDRGKISPEFSSILLGNARGVDIQLTGLAANTPILCIGFDVQLRYNYFGEIDYR